MKLNFPTIKRLSFSVLTVLLCLHTGFSQKSDSEDRQIFAEDKQRCAKLELVEQKALLPSDTKPPSDYFAINEDDISARFELTNNCEKPIYYLQSTVSKSPIGFWIYRISGGEWQSRTPAWRRKGGLTGSGLKWRAIKPGKSISFRATDLSLIKGERSTTIYLSYARSPRQNEIIELMVAPYLPIELNNSKK